MWLVQRWEGGHVRSERQEPSQKAPHSRVGSMDFILDAVRSCWRVRGGMTSFLKAEGSKTSLHDGQLLVGV